MQQYKREYKRSDTPVEQAREWIPCNFASCRQSAMVRSLDKNLCRTHYEQFHKTEAAKWNAANGLDSVEKRKEFCNVMVRSLIKDITRA